MPFWRNPKLTSIGTDGIWQDRSRSNSSEIRGEGEPLQAAEPSWTQVI
jgi:hypothetical protein